MEEEEDDLYGSGPADAPHGNAGAGGSEEGEEDDDEDEESVRIKDCLVVLVGTDSFTGYRDRHRTSRPRSRTHNVGIHHHFLGRI